MSMLRYWYDVGGYQLFGRTLPPWSPWGKGPDFSEEEPWLIRFFDQVRGFWTPFLRALIFSNNRAQIRFEPVTEEEYEKVRVTLPF